ncbi:FAD binding domain-containing protein [Dendrothele bispora CBS 962.96]|uniref:FAD binding domain-containing protein n=1 Tax=Dendrothele bispora (strain CBS 962.96) TaxID=1314807 RepID=A0A4S8ME24_DENBC|nr:FAD binding domain-containing protein [Dendrothele bispora CBS 962.96]
MVLSLSLLLLVSASLAITVDPLNAIRSVTPQQWDALNATVGGSLFQAAPFARPCFENANVTTGVFDPNECQIVQENYLNATFRSGLPGNYEGSQWEGCPAMEQTCLLDTNDPFSPVPFTGRVCTQGSVPDYFVNIRYPSDAQAVFAFAKESKVRVVIKNSGHDNMGRSAGLNTLALRTTNLKNLTFMSEWVPEGCYDAAFRPAVAMGAGVTFRESYPFAEQYNISLPGGACPTVSPGGGYTLGGGHGMLGNAYGLSADRALQFKVVTPSGEFLTANECQNSDLWFALRGGGGGTFGVVLETVHLALPRDPVQIIQIQDFEASNQNIRAYMKIVIEHTKEWALQGWGGFVQLTEFQYINPLISEEEAIIAMQPLIDWATGVNATIIQKTHDSYVTYWAEFLAPFDSPTGVPYSYASRLIPDTNFDSEEAQKELLDTTLEVAAGHDSWFGFATTPYLYGENVNTSATPAWRNSLWHAIIQDNWNFNTTASQQLQILRNLSSSVDGYRRIAPNSGSYLNEADIFEPDFAQSFWGTNYNRLISIKEKYDPDHLLDCWHCVSFMGEDDPAFKCYL